MFLLDLSSMLIDSFIAQLAMLFYYGVGTSAELLRRDLILYA